jgi:CHAD domain-containing protein
MIEKQGRSIPQRRSKNKKVATNTNIDLRQLFFEKIDSIWLRFLKNHRICKTAFSEKSVHDLRVAIRRFQSLVLILRRIMPCPYLDEIHKILRKEIRSFGALRDTQVQIKKILSLRNTFPILGHFYNDLIAREQFYIEEIQGKINQEDLTDLEGLVFFLKMYMTKNLEGKDLQNMVFNITQESFLEVKLRKDAINHNSLESIHQVRLAFKKFRYIMEHLQKYYKISSSMMGKHRKYQTMMGKIQDNVVLFGLLNDFIISHPEYSIKDYLAVLNHISEEEIILVTDFINNASILDTFWIINQSGTK